MKRTYIVCLVVLMLLLAGWTLLQPASRAAGQTAATRAVNPLPAGPGLVYSETAPDALQSDVYWVDPANPEQPVLLAQVKHRPGYPPEGSLSPRGDSLAFLAIAGSATQRAVLWIYQGSELRALVSGVDFLAGWSPDSGALLYGRYIPQAQPVHPEAPFRTELYRLDSASGESTLLVADDEHYALIPLGWAPDNRVWIATQALDGRWQAHALDLAGTILTTIELPVSTPLRRISLSPAGDRVLIEQASETAVSLTLVDLSGAQVSAAAQVATTPYDAGGAAPSPLKGLWGGQSGQVYVFRQTQSAPGVSAQVAGGSVLAAPRISVQAGQALLAESLSPGEDWLAWRVYPNNYQAVYLQRVGATAAQALPMTQPENWITLFGWQPETTP